MIHIVCIELYRMYTYKMYEMYNYEFCLYYNPITILVYLDRQEKWNSDASLIRRNSRPTFSMPCCFVEQAALRGDLCLLRKHIRRSAPPVNAPLHAARGDEYLTLLHVWPSADCGHCTRRFTAAGCLKLII